MRLDPRQLMHDRARIVRIERDQIDHRRARRHHHVAQPVGDLAVGELQQHVERSLGRRAEGKLPHEARGRHGALDAAAKLQKAPAGLLAHVLLLKPGERRNDAQRTVDAVEDRAFVRSLVERRVDHLDQIGERPPGIRREPIADHRGRRLRRAGELRQRAIELTLQQRRRRNQRRPGVEHALGHRIPGAQQAGNIGAKLARLGRNVGGAIDQSAHQTQRRLGALDVAAKPEQVGGGPARQRSGGAVDGDAVGRRQQRGLRHRPFRQDPGVGGAPALLQVDRPRVEIIGDPDEAARHHAPAVRGAGHQQPQYGTSWPLSQTGVVESFTASCATKSMPRRPIASTICARAAGSRS